MGNQSSGNKAMQRQTLRYAHSTLRRCGTVRAQARHIFSWMRYAVSKYLRIVLQDSTLAPPLSAYLYRSRLDCLVTALEILDTHPAERSTAERLRRRR
jgi:hypothetical protein